MHYFARVEHLESTLFPVAAAIVLRHTMHHLSCDLPQSTDNARTIKIEIITFFAEETIFITKTYLYNFDLLKPHFYMVKLGFTGVYIVFLISAQKHSLWVPPRRF